MYKDKLVRDIEYKDYTITFNEKTEQWGVPAIKDQVGLTCYYKTLKEAKKAIRDLEKKDKVVLKPFWAIMDKYGKQSRIYVVNINTRNQVVFYKTKETSKEILKAGTRWGTDIYPDDEKSRVALKLVETYEKRVEEAEKLRDKARDAVQKLELETWDIADKLGKDD